MANKKQRLKNIKNAHIQPVFNCPECGLKSRTGHYVPNSLGIDDGFWICPKFYDSHGRRIIE